MVLADDQARLGRTKPRERSVDLAQLAENEIKIYYTKEGKWEYFEDADGELLSFIRGWQSNQENVDRAGNSLGGTLSKINQGKYRANPIYGYLNRNLDDNDIRLNPCPEYGCYVETIFDTYLKLGSLVNTVKEINKLKIPTLEHRRRWLRDLSGMIATKDCECSFCGNKDKAYTVGDIYRKTARKPPSERRNFYLCRKCLLWNVTSLKTLLQNPLYIGHTYFGRKLSGKIFRTDMDRMVAGTVRAKEKGKKTFNKDARLIENASIPIIKEEDWRLAQKLLREIVPTEMKKRELKNKKNIPIGKK